MDWHKVVEWIISDYSDTDPIDIMDVGVGSGCILLSVISEVAYDKAYGLDVSDEALEVFLRNAAKLQLSCESINMDILTNSPNLNLDVIVSNPPYILESERKRMDNSVLIHEPPVALFVDNIDPLIFYKVIIDIAENLLKKEGRLYFETSDLYHEGLLNYLNEKSLSYDFKKDLQGNWRMLRITFD